LRRVGVFGWGIVAPHSKNIEAFAANLEKPESWLEPFNGFGPSNFLVGNPDFNFDDYKSWIDKRFPPNRFSQLKEKMDSTTLFAVGAFIQSLQQNLGIEQTLQNLGTEAHVYISTGLGNIPTINHISLTLYKAQRKWDRFWASPDNNRQLREYLALTKEEQKLNLNVPPNPAEMSPDDWDKAEETWWAYWTEQSLELKEYLNQLADIDKMTVKGSVEANKLKLIKEKQRLKTKLQEEWNAPSPPWDNVSANILWNIHNTPASQVTMLGRIHGLSMAPVAACSSFNVSLKLAMDSINNGEAKAVVIGASESSPTPQTVGAFSQARVAASGHEISKPLTGLRGTHISGGSAIWIVGDYEYMIDQGYTPLGMEPISVGTSSDAGHIITPSKEGPQMAIRQAIKKSQIASNEITTWDLHATATPGDYMEISNLKKILSDSVQITARKGTFGHGLGVSGGWELTAQYLCYEKGYLFPTALDKKELNSEIAAIHDNFVYNTACPLPEHGYAGKLSMGVGGINACVISKPFPGGDSNLRIDV